MKNKRAQGADAIMTLVIIIALVIVLFVILLPPEERNRLLNQTDENKSNGEVNGGTVKTLLLETPDKVYPTKEDKLEHEINPVNLFVRTEPEIITLANSLQVSRSLFGSQDQTLTFDLENLDNLKDLKLSFNVDTAEGTLSIELNNNIIFNGKISENTPKIITLPINLLKQSNELKIYVSSPGAKFWGTNVYTLSNLKIKQEFEKINSKETRTFSISESEKQSLSSSKLKYFIYCNKETEDTLFKLYLNDNQEVQEVIACGSGERTIEFDIEDIEEGVNSLMFMIDKGDYLISNIKVINQLKDRMFKTYYFSIDSDDFKDITDDKKEVILKLSLAEDKTEKKKAEILINDKSIHLDTYEKTYTKDISDLVEESENIIKIIPDVEFTINTLRITLEEN